MEKKGYIKPFNSTLWIVSSL